MPSRDVYCETIANPVSITANDLSSVGIPPRFWSPPTNPFDCFDAPLSWWANRYANSKSGVGCLTISSPSSFVELASMVELLKRLLCDGDRPSLSGSIGSSCYCIRSTDCLRSVASWEKLVSTGFLLMTGVGVGLSDRLESYLCDLFRARYESGAVTFYHLVERPGDKEFLQRLVSLIPEGSYQA
jgi:hypothetical protein